MLAVEFDGVCNCLFAMQVVWGKISMIDAEKRLLANALEDTDNQFFVLLSDRFGFLIMVFINS